MARQFPTDRTTWQPANNGSGKRIWFVYREPNGARMQVAEDSRGNYRRFASIESAWRAADALNAAELQP